MGLVEIWLFDLCRQHQLADHLSDVATSDDKSLLELACKVNNSQVSGGECHRDFGVCDLTREVWYVDMMCRREHKYGISVKISKGA